MKPNENTTAMHTPGPWTVVMGDSYAIRGANGTTVLEIADTRRLIPMNPDARLISAAPELLDALEALLVIVDRLNLDTYGQPKPGTSSEWKEQVDARAAIAKAKGGVQ